MPLKTDSDKHYALTYRYLQILAIELRAALSRQGVQDAGAQQKILETFMFAVAMSWDSGCIEDSKTRAGQWHPTVCFRDAAEMSEASTIVLPDGADAFHEMAVFGAIEDAMTPQNSDGDFAFSYDGVDGPLLYSSRLDELG